MAIAVLVSSSAESERFTCFGLEFAMRLNQPVIFVCLAPTADKPEDPPSPDQVFQVGSSYVDRVRGHATDHIAKLTYGFINFDVVEVSPQVDEVRKWLVGRYSSENLGYFGVDTLIIPMLRGAGTEHAREAKNRLFETSQVETLYLSVEQSHAGRLPLNDIGVCGKNQSDVLNATLFSRRLANTRVTRFNEQERDEDQHCVVIAIPGIANQTRIDQNNTWKTLRKDPQLPVAILLNPEDTRRERAATALDDRIRYWFRDYQLAREERIKLSDKLQAGASSSPEFILFMSVATFLACIGLIQDSAAVIIGAMLVAPLMIPLLSAGLAMITGNHRLFGNAVRSILLGVGLAFMIGTLVGLLALMTASIPTFGIGLQLTSEMISRSQPNLLDPFIGLAAGLAGGFAIGRDGQIGTVAGVAIAAALVPPIATAGLECALAIYCTIAEADLGTFFRMLARDPGEILRKHGLIVANLNPNHNPTADVQLITAPLILFALNACASIIGAFLGLRLVGMHRTSKPRQSRKWVIWFFALLFAAILLLISLPVLLP